MAQLSLLLLLVLVLAVSDGTAAAADSQYKVVCYYGSWAVYRHGAGKFDVENINPHLCTHAVFTFAGLDPHTHSIFSLDPYNDLEENWDRNAYRRFTNLKMLNPKLKTLLAIGGWNEGSEKYSEMTASPEKRKLFIESCVMFLERFNFDGLDLDWEYPAARGGRPQDRANFAALVHEMSDRFASQDLLLTAAVAQSRATIDPAYDLPVLGRYLDLVNVMAYDYHGTWEKYTGHVAPLFPSDADVNHGKNATELNVNFTVNYFLKGGVPADKITLGIPIYGRGFILANPSQHGMYAPTLGGFPACRYTQQVGMCGYAEICQILTTESGWTHELDQQQQARYVHKNDLWIGYDDLDTIGHLAEMIKAMELGGGMVWSLETDDLNNLCGRGSMPFMHTLWSQLNGDVPPPASTTSGPPPSTETAPTIGPASTLWPWTTTGGPSPGDVCKKPGYNPDRIPCSGTYYECEHVRDASTWRVVTMHCPGDLVFDPNGMVCNYRYNTEGCK